MEDTSMKSRAYQRRHKKKKTFKGNRFTKIQSNDVTSHNSSSPSSTSVLVESVSDDTLCNKSLNASADDNTKLELSASAAKIKMKYIDGCATSPCSTGSTSSEDSDTEIGDSKHDNLYILVNVNILLNLFQLIGKCPTCSSPLNTELNLENKKGFAQQFIISCACGWRHSSYTSEKVASCGHTRYDVNTRAVVAFREIGKGYTSIENFCTVMNMPPPLSQSNYQDIIKDIHPIYMSTAQESMKNAAHDVIEKIKLVIHHLMQIVTYQLMVRGNVVDTLH